MQLFLQTDMALNENTEGPEAGDNDSKTHDDTSPFPYHQLLYKNATDINNECNIVVVADGISIMMIVSAMVMLLMITMVIMLVVMMVVMLMSMVVMMTVVEMIFIFMMSMMMFLIKLII